MTTRKLTPAEALECLRDYHDNDTSASDWERKWAPDSPSMASPAWSCVLMGAIAALEEALAQKHPAAPVPSDEEIREAHSAVGLDDDDCSDATFALLSLIVRRLGVKL